MGEEITDDEGDKGLLTYQECKVFHAEPHLCSVYDHVKRRVVTFEVYGLDTQDMLHKPYTYNEFDNLFRFNAELMNPNRKEGRYHWVIERLEIGQVGTERKLRLGAEVSKEVPELPIYETNRKIPTGRMDLKERQRLRDQMDMLNIRRDEKIRAKKEVSKHKFLQHIFWLQQQNTERLAQLEQTIAIEREKRIAFQLECELEEDEQAKELAIIAAERLAKADGKDEHHEQLEEEDYLALRERWRNEDAAKAQHHKEVVEYEEKQRQHAKREVKREKERLVEVESRRKGQWKIRDKRVQTKRDNAVKKALELLPEIKALAVTKLERNAEYLKDWNRRRWPIFQAQLERMRDRAAKRLAEADAVKLYFEQRAIPEKPNLKAKKKKGTKKGGEEKKERAPLHPPKEKPSGDRAVDPIEAKMRQQMAEVQRRRDLETRRTMKMQEKEDKAKEVELKRLADYKSKMTLQEEAANNAGKARRAKIQSKIDDNTAKEERQTEGERAKAEKREPKVLALEVKQLEFLCRVTSGGPIV